MQSPPKPQFTSWLIEQVETGQYAGLYYVEQNTFRVPWKHNSRKDCNEEDCKIFRAWAVASGKIKEYPNNKAKWKTNFRCTLNNLTKRFQMVKDNSKDNPEDPHKIYKIICNEDIYESRIDDLPDDMILDIYSSPVDYLPPGNELNLLHDFGTMDLNGEEPQWAETCQVVPFSYQVVQSSQTEPPSASQNHTAVVPEPQPYYEVSQQAAPPATLSINDLEVSIHYRRKEVLRTLVSCSRLQLHYQYEVPELQALPLCFPTTDGLADHKQVEYTNRILDCIQRGLLLEVQETGIYAVRQDRCHVFTSTGDPRECHPDPRKLPQDTMVEIMSFKKYVNDLQQFKENNGPSPDYTINMCFGEKFPDGKPLENKLITVKVVPLICRHFHEMAQAGGASSLHSANVSLQISHDSLFDFINNASLPTTTEELLQAAVPF